MNKFLRTIEPSTLIIGAICALTFAYSTHASETPDPFYPVLDHLRVGIENSDVYGATMYTNPLQALKNVGINIASAGANFTYDMPFAINVESNTNGVHVTSDNIAIHGTNVADPNGNYGRTGVVGKAIGYPLNQHEIAIGIAGFIENASASIPPSNPSLTDIPYYAPSNSSEVYGLYAMQGTSRFQDVELGSSSTISSNDIDGIRFADSVDVSGDLSIDGDFTTENLFLDADYYESEILDVYNPNNANVNVGIGSSLDDKMMFYVRTMEKCLDTSSVNDCRNRVLYTTSTCPEDTVLVSCNGFVTNAKLTTNDELSSYRGTLKGLEVVTLNGVAERSCTGYKKGLISPDDEVLYVEALCMHSEAPEHIAE